MTRVSLVFESFRHFLDEYSSHISMGGMFIGARRPLPPGSLCQLEFRLRDGYPLILGRGEVVWTRARDEGPGRPPGMGVRFRELEGNSRGLVFTIVEHRLADGSSLFELEPGDGGDPHTPEALDRLLQEAERRRERAEAEARVPGDRPTQRLTTADVLARLSAAEEADGPAAEARDEAAEAPGPPSEPPVTATPVASSEPLPPAVPMPSPAVSAGMATEPAPPEPRADSRTLAPRAPATSGQELLPGIDDGPLLATPVEVGEGDEDDDPTVVDGHWVVDREPATLESEADRGLLDEPPVPPPSLNDEIARSAGSVLGDAPPDATWRTPFGDASRRGERSGEGPVAAADPGPVGSATGESAANESAAGGSAADVEIDDGGRTGAAFDSGERSAVNLDELFSVAPPAEPTLIERPPRPGRRRDEPRRWWLLAALAVLVLAGATYFLVRAVGWWPPANDTPAEVAEDVAVPTTSPPAATPPASGGAEPAPLPSPAEPEHIDVGSPGEDQARDTAAPTAPSAPARVEPAPPPPPPVPATPAVSGSPARAVRDITWQRTDGGTRLTLTLDGELAGDRVSSVRLGSGTPRQLIRLRGITEPYRPPTVAVDTPELLRVRTGRHVRDGVEELHVVLDLAGPEVVVSGATARGRRLEIDLAAP